MKNRYKGTIKVQWKNGIFVVISKVVMADDLNSAINWLTNEFDYWINNENVGAIEVIMPEDIDKTARPTLDWVYDKIMEYAKTNSEDKMNEIQTEIYKVFRDYSPDWDDDTLSDILDYAYADELDKYTQRDYKGCFNDLIQELDEYIETI